jgi:hypothetical protein
VLHSPDNVARAGQDPVKGARCAGVPYRARVAALTGEGNASRGNELRHFGLACSGPDVEFSPWNDSVADTEKAPQSKQEMLHAVGIDDEALARAVGAAVGTGAVVYREIQEPGRSEDCTLQYRATATAERGEGATAHYGRAM